MRCKNGNGKKDVFAEGNGKILNPDDFNLSNFGTQEE